MIKREDGSYITYEMLQAQLAALMVELAAAKAAVATSTEVIRQLVRERDEARAGADLAGGGASSSWDDTPTTSGGSDGS